MLNNSVIIIHCIISLYKLKKCNAINTLIFSNFKDLHLNRKWNHYQKYIE